MCGIAGIVRCGTAEESAITTDALRSLLIGLESRGNDAAGVALQQPNGATEVFKAAESGSDIAADGKFVTWADRLVPTAIAALVHTRAWTTGPPSKAENNHPLFAGHAVVVHNGMIYNHTEMFARLGWKRNGEVDSDILRAILEELGPTETAAVALSACKGSAAILGLDTRFPGRMFVARDTSPLWLAPVRGQLWFTSTKAVLELASARWVNLGALWFPETRGTNYVPQEWGDYAGVVGPGGIEWRRKWSTQQVPMGKWTHTGKGQRKWSN